MQTKIDQLEREKSEMTGLLTMLRQKVQESSEEIFDLRTNMATIEAEADYVKQKAAESNVREVQKLETKLAFMVIPSTVEKKRANDEFCRTIS